MVVPYHDTILPEDPGAEKKDFLNEQRREHERERGEQLDEHVE
jgi:hypothetical protein